MQRFLLLTTSIITENTEKLEKMINSLRGYHASSDIQIKHVLLLQKTSEEQAKALSESLSFPEWTQVLSDERMLPLSVARNIMLNHVHTSGEVIDNDTVVAFPDDDCWYPEGLLTYIAAIFQPPKMAFLFCRYGTQTVAATKAASLIAPTYKDLVFNASSNTLFLRWAVIKKVGAFNELLGVGAKYNGGEDLDFAIRAYRIAADGTYWTNTPLVGHRDKLNDMKGDYFIGSALALRNNAFYSPAACFHFIRKCIIGCYLVAQGKMPANRLFQLFTRSFRRV
jgi:hypothetical protein